jgi:hypothetical protein
MNTTPISWIRIGDTLISSFMIWTNDYLPYQTVMLRRQTKHSHQLVYYFKLEDKFVGSMVDIPKGRTQTEEEHVFHIAFEGLRMLYQWLNHQENEGQPSPPITKQLQQLIEEAFISDLGMQLIKEEHHPDFGFYSLSPNYKKIAKMVEGKSYSLLEFLKGNVFIK